MATNKQRLEVEMIATDKLSATLTEAAKKVDALDGETATVEVDAEDRASSEVAALMARISGLTDDDKTVILNAEATRLETEVRRATTLLGTVDGETAEAVLDVKNLAQVKLNGIQAELRTIDTTTATATVDATEGAGLSGLLDKLQVGIPGSVSGIGSQVGGLAKKGGPVGLLAAAFGGAAVEASNTAIEVDQIARFTGSSTEDASRLYAVWTDNKLQIGDLLDILAQMQGVLEANPALADQLGISMDEVRRNPLKALITSVDLLNSDQLTANEKILLGAQLFGEEGVRQINQITAAVGDEGLQAAIDGVSESRVVSDADVAAAREFKEQWLEFSDLLKSIAAEIGPEVLGALTTIINAGGDLAGVITDIRQALPGGDDDTPFTDFIDDHTAAVAKLAVAEGVLSAATAGAAASTETHGRVLIDSTAAADTYVTTVKTANDALSDFLDSEDPMRSFGDQWRIVMADIADGEGITQGTADAMNQLRAAYPEMSDADIIGQANRLLDEQTAATEEAETAIREGLAGALDTYRTDVEGVSGALVEHKAATDEANAALVDGLVVGLGEHQGAVEGVAAAIRDEYIASLQEEQAAQQEALDKLREKNDALLASGDSYFATRDAQRQSTEQEKAYQEMLAETEPLLAEAIRQGRSAADIDLIRQKGIDDLVRSYDREAAAVVDEAKNTRAASGATMSNVEAIRLHNRTLLDKAAALNGPERDAVLNHIARINGIPAEKVSEIRALLNAGDIAGAERELSNTSRARQTEMRAVIDQAALASTVARLVAASEPRVAPVTAVANTHYAQVAINALDGQRVGLTASLDTSAAQNAVYRLGQTLRAVAALGSLGRATGDEYFRGGPVTVGEQGPEAVWLPRGSKITPNHRMDTIGAPASPSVTYVTNNFPAGADPRQTYNAGQRHRRRNGLAAV